MMNILIINNAEKDIIDFVSPMKEFLNRANINSNIIQYSNSSTINISDYDGIILSASPKGNDIVNSHL